MHVRESPATAPAAFEKMAFPLDGGLNSPLRSPKESGLDICNADRQDSALNAQFAHEWHSQVVGSREVGKCGWRLRLHAHRRRLGGRLQQDK